MSDIDDEIDVEIITEDDAVYGPILDPVELSLQEQFYIQLTEQLNQIENEEQE